MSAGARKTDKAKKKTIKGKKYLRFACAGCGRCCALWIPVTDADVVRLMEGTGEPAREIVGFTPIKAFKKNTPGSLRVVKFGKKKKDWRVMCVKEKGGGCQYLKENRCVVYEHRPVVCREHPLMIEPSAKGKRIKKIDLNDPCGCAGTLTGRQRKKDLLNKYHWTNREDDAYAEKVEWWNEGGGGSEEDFLRYMGLAGGRTAAREEGAGSEADESVEVVEGEIGEGG